MIRRIVVSWTLRVSSHDCQQGRRVSPSHFHPSLSQSGHQTTNPSSLDPLNSEILPSHTPFLRTLPFNFADLGNSRGACNNTTHMTQKCQSFCQSSRLSVPWLGHWGRGRGREGGRLQRCNQFTQQICHQLLPHRDIYQDIYYCLILCVLFVIYNSQIKKKYVYVYR